MPINIVVFLLMVCLSFSSKQPSKLSSDTLFIKTNGAILHRLEFNTNRSPLTGYQLNANGAYTIHCSPEGGGATQLLRGVARGLSSTGVSFPISGHDTFYVRNIATNVVEHTIILEPSKGDQFKIIYGARTNSSYNLTQTQASVNKWLRDTLSALKFDRVY